MKAKKILCSLLSVAMIGSVGTLGVSAADYTERNIDMNSSWTRFRNGSVLTCMYWPAGVGSCSAQTRLLVTESTKNNSTAYVYVLGQGYTVGNRKQNSSASGDTITTPRCYANGDRAAQTYHSYERGNEANSYTFYYN